MATVSRVLNNKQIVAPEKHELVMKAIKELNYKPNRVTHPPIAKTILVVMGIALDETMSGIRRAAEEHGCHVLFHLCTTTQAVEEVQTLANIFEPNLLGIILYGCDTTNPTFKALSKKFLIVQLYEPVGNFEKNYIVANDEYAMSCNLTEHILSTGKRKIAFLEVAHAPTDFVANSNLIRHNGFTNTLERFGVEYRSEYRLRIDSTLDGGKLAARQLMQMEEPPDAIICPILYTAIGCISELNNQHIAIPDIVAVVSFDDYEDAEFVTPPITAIFQPHSEIGYEAVQLLAQIADNRYPNGHKKLIAHSLIERQSSVSDEHN